MRPPSQAVHSPFETGPFRMAMGLRTVPETAWFEIDQHYQAEISERRRLLTRRRDEVFGVTSGSEAARTETLTMVIEHLTRVHPHWFVRTGNSIHARLTGIHFDLAAYDPLELAGCLVQEDLCLIEASPDGPRLTAAVLCFPSRWRLGDKLGHPLAAVHRPVPLYAGRLAQPVDRFMAKLRPGHIVSRSNWSVLDDPALFQPEGKWREAVNGAIAEENAGETLFLRVERQSLRRLPESGAILFGIRVHVYPLHMAVPDQSTAARLAEAVRALPEETAHYKSIPAFRTALLGWLATRRGGI